MIFSRLFMFLQKLQTIFYHFLRLVHIQLSELKIQGTDTPACFADEHHNWQHFGTILA